MAKTVKKNPKQIEVNDPTIVEHKCEGKMPPHTFILLKDHTHDRLYFKGETITLDRENLVKNLLTQKIIK